LFHFIFFITTPCNFSRALQLLDLGKSDAGHFSLAMSKARFSSLPQLIRAAVPCACA
jgi:hypothetical protein